MKQSSIHSARGFADFAPLKFVLVYLLVTFAIAVLGPVQYINFEKGLTAIFMVAVSASIICGYAIGVHSMVSFRPPSAELKSSTIRALLDASLAISLAALTFTTLYEFSSGNINTSLSGLGDAYFSGYENYERNSGNYSYSFLLYSFSLPFFLISCILGMFYFVNLSITRKLVLLTIIAGTVFVYTVGGGKQKQFGDIVIYLLVVGALKYGIHGREIGRKLVVWMLLIGAVSTLAFIGILGQRYAAINVGALNINQRSHPLMWFDLDHPTLKLLGLDYGFAFGAFTSYFSQGYYGLSLALRTEADWTFMVGSSYSLSVIAERLLGFEWQWPNTIVYQVGATTGWGETKWHTAFAHFATDFTWLGTVLLFGFFAFVYARSWLLSIRYANPFAILMFGILTVGVFFLPANNQLFHSPGSLLSLLLVVFLYSRSGHFSASNIEFSAKGSSKQAIKRSFAAR